MEWLGIMPVTLRETTGTRPVHPPVHYTAMQRTTKKQATTRWCRGGNAFLCARLRLFRTNQTK